MANTDPVMVATYEEVRQLALVAVTVRDCITQQQRLVHAMKYAPICHISTAMYELERVSLELKTLGDAMHFALTTWDRMMSE